MELFEYQIIANDSSEPTRVFIDEEPWLIYWTGWKPRSTNSQLHGQFIAIKARDFHNAPRRIVSSCPGYVDVYNRMDEFNTCLDLDSGQILVEIFSGEDVKLAAKIQTMNRLIEFIKKTEKKS